MSGAGNVDFLPAPSAKATSTGSYWPPSLGRTPTNRVSAAVTCRVTGAVDPRRQTWVTVNRSPRDIEGTASAVTNWNSPGNPSLGISVTPGRANMPRFCCRAPLGPARRRSM
jgi:hypothetical protein